MIYCSKISTLNELEPENRKELVNFTLLTELEKTWISVCPKLYSYMLYLKAVEALYMKVSKLQWWIMTTRCRLTGHGYAKHLRVHGNGNPLTTMTCVGRHIHKWWKTQEHSYVTNRWNGKDEELVYGRVYIRNLGLRFSAVIKTAARLKARNGSWEFDSGVSEGDSAHNVSGGWKDSPFSDSRKSSCRMTAYWASSLFSARLHCSTIFLRTFVGLTIRHFLS